MKHFPLYAPLLLTFAPLLIQACGKPKASDIKEAWDPYNRPGLLDIKDELYATEYTYEWKKLPLKGELKNRPWSDDYWPTYRGGISYRWNHETDNEESRYAYDVKPAAELKKEDIVSLSPAEKLDLFISEDNYPITMRERYRTNVLKTVESSVEYDANFSIPTWEGLCHAWAPAALIFQEPQAVTLKNSAGLEISFGASDVKALLTYLMHYSSSEGGFLGQRCDLKFSEYLTAIYEGRLTEEEYKNLKNSAACRDLNAGSFHVVLSNQIGRLNEGFVADVTRDHEVWNQPVYKFESRVVEEKAGASPGAAFGTVREISLETTMYYAGETTPHWEVNAGTFNEASKTYRYRVELNAQGTVIGGEWLDDERPDFFWEPGRPYYDSEEESAIKEIYEASIRLKR